MFFLKYTLKKVFFIDLYILFSFYLIFLSNRLFKTSFWDVSFWLLPMVSFYLYLFLQSVSVEYLGLSPRRL